MFQQKMIYQLLYNIINEMNPFVVTLTLGSRPMQGHAKVRAKSEAQESHFMFSGV